MIKNLEFHSIQNMYKIPGEGAVGGVAVEADVPEDQQDLAGAPFLPAMLEQVSVVIIRPATGSILSTNYRPPLKSVSV